jgi:hypothetical protein
MEPIRASNVIAYERRNSAMTIDLNAIRQKTRAALGDDVDLSGITEKVVSEAKANAQPLPPMPGQMEGNTVLQEGGKWKWRKDCSASQWYEWGGHLRTTRLVNCANGFLKFRIEWW